MTQQLTQEQRILEYLKSGQYLTKLEAARRLACPHLSSVISVLRRRGHVILNEERTAKRSGKFYIAYYMPSDGKQPNAPTLFPEDMLTEDTPIKTAKDITEAAKQVFDTLDLSETALRQNSPPSIGGTELREVGKSVDASEVTQDVEDVQEASVVEEVPPPAAPESQQEAEPVAFELRDHHVANPDDPVQILEAFRKYCEPFHGRKVPVTPDWARLLLRLNRMLPPDLAGDLRQNRHISSAKLELYKADLRSGTFYFTNVGIGFDANGMLADGQTRLTACRDTGITFYSNVDFDLAPETFAVVDSKHSVRTGADIASMTGVSRYTRIHAAAASHLYRRDHGMRHNAALSALELVTALKIYEVGPSVEIARSIPVQGPKSIFAAVHYLAAQIDKPVADKMFEDLKTGAISDPKDPVLVARNRLLTSYASSHNEFKGAGSQRVRVLLSRAFNHRRNGVTLSRYLLDGGDDWPEAKAKETLAAE